MQILLPPSEGKTPGDRAPINLANLSFPQLNEARKKLGDALVELSFQPQAAKILKLGTKSVSDLAFNQFLWEQPTAPAGEIYSGVLYEAAGLPEFFANQQGVATQLPAVAENIHVVSALWGLVGLNDLIPAYRLSAGCELPGIGKVSSFWRAYLVEPLADKKMILNLCSGAYTQCWEPQVAKLPAANRPIIVHSQIRKAGKVVSHWAKHTRGLILRQFLQADQDIWETCSDPQSLVDYLDQVFRAADLGRVLLADGPRGSYQLLVDLV